MSRERMANSVISKNAMFSGAKKGTHFTVFVIFVVLFIILAIVFVIRSEQKKRDQVKEGFAWTNWEYEVKGRVGKEGVLNDETQAEVRREIESLNRTFDTCIREGVDLPQDWRPTTYDDTCSLDMTNIVVRNQCSMNNSPLGDSRVVNKVYIDPKTLKCHIMFKPGVTSEQMREYKERIDIGALLREVTHLRERIRELEEEIAALESEIQQLEEELENQKSKIRSKEREIRTLESKLSELRDTVRNRERTIKTLERNIAAINKVKQSL